MMFHTRYVSHAEIQEILHERVLHIILPGMVASGYVLLASPGVSGRLGRSLLVLALFVLPFIIPWVLSRWYQVGLWALVLSLFVMTYLSWLAWDDSPILVSLMTIPAVLATLLLGRGWGLAISILASGVLLWGESRLGFTIGSSRSAELLVIWSMQALAWVASCSIGLTIQMLDLQYQHIYSQLEQARDQRLEMKQTQEDLVHANLELERLSERLAAMRELAEEARRAKEEFVANVSHELRTPLNMIIGFSEMITDSPGMYGAPIPPMLLADIAVIERNSQHLASLVDDVLDLSQVEAGRMALSKEKVSLQDIIRAAVIAVRPLFESKGLYLEVDVPEPLPEVLCDRTRVRQVILNLLSNAGRFTEQGGIKVRAWQEDRHLVVSVSDTGPGISPENQKRLFEPFQQLDPSLARQHGGSGLGLAISKRFVEMHGGKMWIESQVGVGTTFLFSLPLMTVPSPTPPMLTRWFSPYHQYEPRTRPSKTPKLKPSPRLVVVESGQALQKLLARYWSGVEITQTHSIEEGIANLNLAPAQALIVNDPGLDSDLSQSRKMTHLPYGTPAITLWVPGKEEAAASLGVASYLVKPISRDDLLSALDALGSTIKTILIVDDSPEVQQLFTRTLISAGRGYRVLRASSGTRALSLLREQLPDVVLLDLILPDMDGYSLLQEKSSDPLIRAIPVVVVSAKDPTQEVVSSSSFAVTRSGGFSVRDLLTCIQVISEALTPHEGLKDWQRAKSEREQITEPAG